MTKFTPEQMAAIEALYGVVLQAIKERNPVAEVEALRRAGVELHQINVQLIVEGGYEETALKGEQPSQPAADPGRCPTCLAARWEHSDEQWKHCQDVKAGVNADANFLRSLRIVPDLEAQ